MLSVKQGAIKYDFVILWFDSTWYWIQVSWAIGKHSNHYVNLPQIHLGCSTFPLFIELNALEKSTNKIIASRLFARTPSMIWRIVKLGIDFSENRSDFS